MPRTMLFIALMTGLFACPPGAATAASQGRSVESQDGHGYINAEIAALVRVSSLHDFNIDMQFVAEDLKASETGCIWSTTGGYSITGIGSGTDGAFTVTQGTHELPYRAQWDDSFNQERSLKANRTVTERITDAVASDCDGDTNSNLEIIIETGDLEAAPAGLYSGTLTLIVAVE